MSKQENSWLYLPELQNILTALGGVHKARCVGGCVRNSVLGKPITDIDIATTNTPDQTEKILNSAGIKTIPTGVDHGTITAVTNGHTFEITTLRTDVKTDGRHATVRYTDNWHEDANRRDFTINALYMDQAGKLYDPTGQGLEDIAGPYIKFIGNPEDRIAEDYLRILRFFRFWAQYASEDLDEKALRACKDNAKNLNLLSKERITNELLKIIMTPKAAEAIEAMRHCNILPSIITPNSLQKLRDMIDAEQKACVSEIASRLLAINADKKIWEHELTLSNAQRKKLAQINAQASKNNFNTAEATKKHIYYHGREISLLAYLYAYSPAVDKNLIHLIQNWKIPIFPITGQDLIAEGFTPGPPLGAELRKREKFWLQDYVQDPQSSNP